jgi:hypothetical protein
MPAVGSVDARTSETPSGIGASRAVGTAASSAHAPLSTRPTTRVPTAGPLPSAAARSTTPAASHPVGDPSRSAGRRSTSPRLSDTAPTRTSA